MDFALGYLAGLLTVVSLAAFAFHHGYRVARQTWP
jgi:hypothetical protein